MMFRYTAHQLKVKSLKLKEKTNGLSAFSFQLSAAILGEIA